MAVTPYGAVMGVNTPNPMESFNYFRQMEDRDEMLDIRRKEQAYKEAQLRNKNYEDQMKPFEALKIDSNNIDMNRALYSQQGADLEEIKKMQKEGVPDSQIRMRVNEMVNNINFLQNTSKDAVANFEKQLGGIGPDSGIDSNKMRNLFLSKYFFTDDGKGGKRMKKGTELDDPSGYLNRILSEDADSLTLGTTDKLTSDIKGDADYSQEMRGTSPDGKRGQFQISGKYNTTFQQPIKGKDGTVRLHTIAEDLTQDGVPVVGPDGKPVKVLPEAQYNQFVSSYDRNLVLNQRTNQRMREIKAEAERANNAQADNMMSMMYGQMKGATPAERLRIRGSVYDAVKKTAPPINIDRDMLRRQVAYEMVDSLLPKELKYNEVKDPQKVTVRVSTAKEKPEHAGVGWVREAQDAIGTGDMNRIQETFSVLERGGHFIDIKTTKDKDGNIEVQYTTPKGEDQEGKPIGGQVLKYKIANDANLRDKLIGVFQRMTGSNEKVEWPKDEKKSAPAPAATAPAKKEISRKDLAAKAAASGYSTKEYEALLKQKGVTIKD